MAEAHALLWAWWHCCRGAVLVCILSLACLRSDQHCVHVHRGLYLVLVALRTVRFASVSMQVQQAVSARCKGCDVLLCGHAIFVQHRIGLQGFAAVIVAGASSIAGEHVAMLAALVGCPMQQPIHVLVPAPVELQGVVSTCGCEPSAASRGTAHVSPRMQEDGSARQHSEAAALQHPAGNLDLLMLQEVPRQTKALQQAHMVEVAEDKNTHAPLANASHDGECGVCKVVIVSSNKGCAVHRCKPLSRALVQVCSRCASSKQCITLVLHMPGNGLCAVHEQAQLCHKTQRAYQC